MLNTPTVLRLSDNFFGRRGAHSIDRAGDLKFFIGAVTLVYVFVLGTLFTLRDKLCSQGPITVNNLVIEFLPPPKPVPVPETSSPGPAKNDVSPRPAAAAGVTQNSTASKTAARKSTAAQPAAAPAAPPTTITKTEAPKPTTTQPKENPTIATAKVQPSAPVAPVAPSQNTNQLAETGDKSKGAEAPGAGTATQPASAGGQGNGQGADGQQIAMAAPKVAGIARAVGNIAPYRKDMLSRLAVNWNPTELKGKVVLVITLSKEGLLLNSQVLASSGSESLDKYALDTVGKTAFAPLPDWFTGSQLKLKVELATQEAVRHGT